MNKDCYLATGAQLRLIAKNLLSMVLSCSAALELYNNS